MRCLSTNSWLYLPSNTRSYIKRVGKYSETHRGLTGSISHKRFTTLKSTQIIENTWDFSGMENTIRSCVCLSAQPLDRGYGTGFYVQL